MVRTGLTFDLLECSEVQTDKRGIQTAKLFRHLHQCLESCSSLSYSFHGTGTGTGDSQTHPSCVSIVFFNSLVGKNVMDLVSFLLLFASPEK